MKGGYAKPMSDKTRLPKHDSSDASGMAHRLQDEVNLDLYRFARNLDQHWHLFYLLYRFIFCLH